RGERRVILRQRERTPPVLSEPRAAVGFAAMPKLIAPLLVLVGLLPFAQPCYGQSLRVGAAALAMEADDSMVIAGGIGPGKAIGQEGELRATAVVIEKGPTKVAIVSCDILFVP